MLRVYLLRSIDPLMNLKERIVLEVAGSQEYIVLVIIRTRNPLKKRERNPLVVEEGNVAEQSGSRGHILHDLLHRNYPSLHNTVWHVLTVWVVELIAEQFGLAGI